MAKGYWIAHIDPSNQVLYDLFKDEALDVIDRLGGRVIVRGDVKTVVSGSARERVLVVEFSSYDDALALYQDAQHRQIRELMGRLCCFDMMIVPGVEDREVSHPPTSIRLHSDLTRT